MLDNGLLCLMSKRMETVYLHKPRKKTKLNKWIVNQQIQTAPRSVYHNGYCYFSKDWIAARHQKKIIVELIEKE